jgi:hypothetical protein
MTAPCLNSAQRDQPFKDRLGVKFFNDLPDLHPLCLTYLTYIYIYNKGSSTAQGAQPQHKRCPIMLGRLGRPNKPPKINRKTVNFLPRWVRHCPTFSRDEVAA